MHRTQISAVAYLHGAAFAFIQVQYSLCVQLCVGSVPHAPLCSPAALSAADESSEAEIQMNQNNEVKDLCGVERKCRARSYFSIPADHIT